MRFGWMILLLTFASPAFAETKLLDGVAAIVDRTVITFSELLLQARLEKAESGGLKAAKLAIGKDELKKTLDRMIARTQLAEAASFDANLQITESMVSDEYSNMKGLLGDSFNSLLEQCGADADTMRTIAKRRLFSAVAEKKTANAKPRSPDVRIFDLSHALERAGAISRG